jgi:maleylpyruvate isomerase
VTAVDRSGAAPWLDLAALDRSQARFDAAIAGMGDHDVTRPTGLPGWTKGHVLTHVARNADSHVRRIDGAIRGESVDQYPGGVEGRAAAIEAGADRPAADLLADVRASGQTLGAAWRSVPEAAWSAVSRDAGGRERRLDELPARRWQELEVHLVDLDVGVTHRDWPEAFVALWLPRMRPTLGERLAPGDEAPSSGALDAHDELAWLYGRLRRPDLPELAPMG